MKSSSKTFCRLAALSVVLLAVPSLLAVIEPLRPPAVPLVACDPYFSIWSPADKLTDADTMHWTRKPHRLDSQVRIDGQAFRLIGANPSEVPALPQAGLEITPTRTIYSFAGSGIKLTLTFMTPALPDDMMVLSRPVTYVTYEFSRTDATDHQVSFQFGANGEIARNQPGQELTPSITGGDGSDFWYNVIRIGTTAQPVLRKKGDDVRIDWGWLYLAGRADQASASYPPETSTNGTVSSYVARLDFAAFKVSDQPVSRMLMLAYDDEFSIQYFKQNLRPYWRRNGDDAAALLKKSAAEYESLKTRCEKFDAELMADLRQAGGEKYARLCALAYRQIVAGPKIVADANGQPLLFPKENTSNGCIGTVDVIYPMAPFFLLFSPSLTKAMLVPPLDYAGSPRWSFPFAPHDLGTYPLANGQVYGGGERTEDNQMPVEETGNLLILLAALAEGEGNADFCVHILAGAGEVGGVPEGQGLRPRAPALHGRFCRPSRAQREPLRQGDRGAGRLRPAVRTARRQGAGGGIHRPGQAIRRSLGEGGGRRRPFPAGVRPAGHVEPEIQPDLGSRAAAESVLAGSRCARKWTITRRS